MKRRILVLLAIAIALLGCAPSGPATTVATHALAFIEDDWPRALAQARQRDVPLLVEAWAPW